MNIAGLGYHQSGLISTSAQITLGKELGQPHEYLCELLDLVTLQTQFEGHLTTLVGLGADIGINDAALMIFSGVSSATFSISTPPSVEAMNTIRRLPRSTTAPR
jgi:hypothetical protein